MPPHPCFAQFNKLYSQGTKWSGTGMTALVRMIVWVVMATLFNSSASERNPFTEALLCIDNLIYFHIMAQYWYYHQDAIQYMAKYLEEFHHQKDGFGRFCPSKSIKMVFKALKMLFPVVKLEEWESDPAWNNLVAAAMWHGIDKDKIQFESEIAQHLVDESEVNFVKIHLLTHFSD